MNEAEAENNLRDAVEAFVGDYMTDRPPMVMARTITDAFISSHVNDGWPELPADLRLAAYLGIQQLVRPLLRRLDDIANAADDAQLDLDLPEEAFLQDYYSVPSGDGDPLYIRRDTMNLEQMETITRRDRKLASHFLRRADALESWWHRAHPETS